MEMFNEAVIEMIKRKYLNFKKLISIEKDIDGSFIVRYETLGGLKEVLYINKVNI